MYYQWNYTAAAPEAVVRRAEGDYAGAAPQPARPRVGGGCRGGREGSHILTK